MRRSVTVLVAFVISSSVALASQPGQPLDCSDFVIDQPGITCRKVRDCGVEPTTGNPDFPCMVGGGTTADAEAHLIGAEYLEPVSIDCNGGTRRPGRVEIKAIDGASERLIAHADGRCAQAGTGIDTILPRSVVFDLAGGRLYVYLESSCLGSGSCPYNANLWLAAFEGFTTMLDVLDSFSPSGTSVGFRVPQRPEGLRAADRFDTYWGTVSRPLDLSQARPLQCAYPDHQPQAGEYLDHPDAAPTPTPGQAIYYLTSVTYQGQTRAGRHTLAGRLAGRDATTLPACTLDNRATR